MTATDLPPIDQVVAKALEENGFYYDGMTQIDCYPFECQKEECFGWEIQTYSVFAVVHKATGHYWFSLAQEETSQGVPQVKQIIHSAIATYFDSIVN